ncbi:unnamed protein product, partial [Clonostachys chloroleuca]
MSLQATVLGLAALLNVVSSTAVDDGCNALAFSHPDKTFFPGSERYKFENEYSWTSTTYLWPCCIFAPQGAEDVQFALQTFREHQVQFAIRCGGAMPIDNAANIGPEGIMMAMTNLTSMAISDDTETVTIGAGVTWPPLYAYLDEFGVTANGIRSGKLPHMKPEMLIYTPHKLISWGPGVSEQYIKSVEQFALHGAEHPKASFEGQTCWVPSRSPEISFDGYLWYSGEGGCQWSNEFNYAPPLGTRAIFHWLTSDANATAARIAFDTYYESIASLADVEGFSTAFSMLPITPIVTAAPRGNAMSLGQDDSPAIWYVESPL